MLADEDGWQDGLEVRALSSKLSIPDLKSQPSHKLSLQAFTGWVYAIIKWVLHVLALFGGC